MVSEPVRPHEPPSGKLVVFEGVDGVGKSTLALRLRIKLAEKGVDALVYSLPGQEHGTLAAHIYKLYHDPGKFAVTSIMPGPMQVLVTAAHVEMIQSRILPALRQNMVVILDRYWWSTWVYGRASGVPARFIDSLLSVEALAWDNVLPTSLFLVKRSAHSTLWHQNLKKHVELEGLYKALSLQEKRSHPVHTLRNDGTIEGALTRVLAQVAKDGAAPPLETGT